MANHVLVKEPTDWHCLCCGKNFPLVAPGKEAYETEKAKELSSFLDYLKEYCPVNTQYEEARAKIKPLPEIKDLETWDAANAILIENLLLLEALDEVMSDGLQATRRRHPLDE
jgi:hypothetical protein